MTQKISIDPLSAPLQQIHDNPLDALLEKPVLSAPVRQLAPSGVALGRVLEIAQDGRMLLSIPVIDAEPLWAASLCRLSSEQIGQTCAVQFINGDASQPLIIGVLLTEASSAAASVTVTEDDQPPKQLMLEAKERLVLRCGKSFIIMTADGVIDMQGVYLSSRARATHRIRAGSLQAN
jgi:hypothetical protein